MTSDLLTPATAELLAGWCGPVAFLGEPAVCVWNDGESAELWLGEDGAQGVPVGTFGFDLSRAECRDRAARVLAERQTGRPCPNGVWLEVEQTRASGIVLVLHTEHGPEHSYPWLAYADRDILTAEILTHAHPEALALRLCLEATRG